MEIIKSTLLNQLQIKHGFSTRTGGVSQGVWESANMHFNTEDKSSNIIENRKRFFNSLSLPLSKLKVVTQSHGGEVVNVSNLSFNETEILKIDGLFSTKSGDILGIYTADCLPVLISNIQKNGAMALHAGWRGITAGILQKGIELFCSTLNCKPKDLLISVGPGIAECCFEIGEEVVKIFDDLGFNKQINKQSYSKPHINLQGCIIDILQNLQIPQNNIWLYQGCTFCEKDKFFSYRRDGWPIGEMLSVIEVPI